MTRNRIVSNGGTICSGFNATFTVNGSNGATLNYTITGQVGTQQLALTGINQTITALNATSNVTLTLSSIVNVNCSSSTFATTTSTVTVNALPIVTASNVSGCSGTAIALSGLPLGGTFSEANPYTGPSTTYTYSYTDGNGCSATSDPASITTNPLPATPTISAGSATTFCLGGSVTLTASSGSTYLWSTGATTPSITVTTSGNYSVQVTNGFGCQSAFSADTIVTVTAQPIWYLDADNDQYYTGTPQASCTSPGAGYTTATLIGGGDCSDNNAAINPGATDICYNNIDENCNGTKSDGCAAVVVNMTQSYDNSLLAPLSKAIPAVAYTYPGATNLKYRYSITNLVTGITAADVIQTSRYVTIPASIHQYNATYTIKASAVINDEVVAFAGNTITVFSPTVEKIALSIASCGTTLATLPSTISAAPGLNATSYTFRIRLNDGNPTPTYGYSSSASRFVSANSFTGFPLQYSTSYKISVQYTSTDPVSNLPVESGYGAECTINTPTIPLISLASPSCGSQVAALNANISASSALYATGYQFRIRLTTDNGPTPTYYTSVTNVSRFSSLTAFVGITYAYNTQYSISVQYSLAGTSGTIWSGYGSECIVKTPFFPTTSLVQSQCGLVTPTSLTQQLNIIAYPGFPNYRVKLEEIDGEDVTNSQELVFTYSHFRLNQFSIAQSGKNYNVSVAIKLGNVFGDYSTACDLFTPAASRTIQMPFKATAYPNPFANNFMLDVKTTSQSAVSIKVYDMVGRLIEQREVRLSDMENTTIGDQYPSGVYNIIVSQDKIVETLRVVKR